MTEDDKLKSLPTDGRKIVGELVSKAEESYMGAADNYWLRALIQGIPAVGGSLDTVIFGEAEENWKEWVEAELAGINQKLASIENKIDRPYIETHITEFSYITKRLIVLIGTDYREEKRSAYASALVNFLTQPFSREPEKDFILNLLTMLTPGHFKVLKLACKRTRSASGASGLPAWLVNQSEELGLERDVTESLTTDLTSRGLISVFRPAVGDTRHSVSVMGTKLLKLVDEIQDQ